MISSVAKSPISTLTRRPIWNHTKRGDLVYEPFLGSGTTLAVAELTERV
jgi:DNA modification methylase